MRKLLLASIAALALAAATPALAQRHEGGGEHGGGHGGGAGGHAGGGSGHGGGGGAGGFHGGGGAGGHHGGAGGANPLIGGGHGGTGHGGTGHGGTGGHHAGGNPGAIFGTGGHGFHNGNNLGRGHNNAFNALRRAFNAPRHFHAGNYRRPSGWYYRRWNYGDYLPALFFAQSYWLEDYADYNLTYPPPGTVWVRYGNDALLVDQDSGEVIQVVYGIFY